MKDKNLEPENNFGSKYVIRTPSACIIHPLGIVFKKLLKSRTKESNNSVLAAVLTAGLKRTS